MKQQTVVAPEIDRPTPDPSDIEIEELQTPLAMTLGTTSPLQAKQHHRSFHTYYPSKP